MGVFDDFSQFLELRLEEFLRDNPHLELMVLEEKLRDQEEETLKLMTDLKVKEKTLQDEILAIAQEIQLWHARIEKAKAKGRVDLAEPAEVREADLLRQGNQKWGQLEMLKERFQQTQELQKKVEQRRKEVQRKVSEAQVNRTATQAGVSSSANWSKNPTYMNSSGGKDPLDQQFNRWEAEEELEQLKRNMGK
ncbi:TIGR04376 family protein [Phormidium sp. CLA17]|uniref:TIGR04376 family protein n=1 Tax=Leptolyngbya sp. Cla-17 TaxID=2803751 RepID=UPI0014918BEA|nr:TIGR04376 family protein [Leptolyngbya sp. Cla-17]MBM0742007.1 TIGR04376 family protein [Leptolyngbya sp. Cla-17]